MSAGISGMEPLPSHSDFIEFKEQRWWSIFSVFGARQKQMALAMCGLVVGNMQKVIISLGLVAMEDEDANHNYPTIKYSTSEKGVVVSAFYYGYLVGCLPWGLSVSKFGPTKVIGVVGGVALGLVTCSMPLFAIYGSFQALCVARSLQGFFFGSILPSIHLMNSIWVLPEEREKFSWIFSGIYSGQVLSTLAGIFAVSPGGWPSIFYVSGGLGITYGIVCLKFSTDSPGDCKSITKTEKNCNQCSSRDLYPNKKSLSDVPWRAILTSIPVWTAFITQSAERWGMNFMNNFFPTFLRGVYGFDIETNGILSTLPGLSCLICTFVFAYLGNILRAHTSLNFSRKFWNTFGFYIPSILLLVLATVDTGAAGAVAILTICSALTASHANGCLINTLDLAPNFAGVLVGIVFAPTNCAAILSSTFTGYAISDEKNITDWQTVFLVASIVYFAANTLFLLFGSTEVQPWNDVASLTKP